jgi:hypothetical protein
MGIVADFEAELIQHSPTNYARWHAVDLHNHSPTSRDYQGNRATAEDECVTTILSSNAAIIMFTDHEQLPDRSFIDSVAKRTKRTVIRGVELNVFVDAWGKPAGKVDKSLFCHLLLGFDPDGKQEPDYWLSDIYRKCGGETRNSGGTAIKGVCKSIDTICEVLQEANAIVIPAHLHSTQDAFKSRSVDDIYADPEFLRYARDRFTALEVTDSKTADFFDGKHKETDFLRKTCIRSSDAHLPELIGTRVTYVQMETPNFLELKAGLELPSRTVLTAPPEPASFICGLNIKGQFFPDLWLSLSPHCNALIGVKGSGKTSILECLRFALGAPVPSSRQESVQGHIQSILGGAGAVRVLVKRADGAKILIQRSINDQSYKVTFADDRQEQFASSDGLMFPSYILGWHEIEQVATDPNIRQIYLDTIAGREQIRQLQEEAKSTAQQIQYQHAEVAHSYAAFRALHDKIGHLEELRKGLGELKDQNLIELRDQYETALRHKEAVQELRRATQENLDQMDARASAFSLKAEKATFEGASPVRELATTAYAPIEAIKSRLSTFVAEQRGQLTDLLSRLDALIPRVFVLIRWRAFATCSMLLNLDIL